MLLKKREVKENEKESISHFERTNLGFTPQASTTTISSDPRILEEKSEIDRRFAESSNTDISHLTPIDKHRGFSGSKTSINSSVCDTNGYKNYLETDI